MSIFQKRWFRTCKATRIAVGSVYLFITFTIPLYHTCGLGGRGQQTCHCDNSPHYFFCPDGSSKQSEVSLRKGDYNPKVIFYYGLCAACMNSTTSNATEVNIGAATISNEISTSFTSLPSSSVVKKSEWLSSVYLRAPPFSIS